MQPASLKSKVQRILLKGNFKKSESSKSRVKGLSNITAGFKYDKMWDDYYLFYTSGNMIYRGMSSEKKDEKTIEIFNYLSEQGLGENIEMTTLRNQRAILLKVK
ncbi:hypothetical protein [Bacillus pumilus]|uniref:hypothetical protein n=1 Tax=Bacillus pumilus TaxID=1408 RepID=UPI002282279E|nr:hypothetical protein [Bacillus pumilus]MCY7500130.1 hypothetical protein [Bacillus pumilus]MCY7528546.1 hypothetical protein [Bacillus pumilus]MED4439495.1 hypothetical protein [Bacillus pumilus]MED4489938.1 hypothetical protein [Bacillus pumilus]